MKKFLFPALLILFSTITFSQKYVPFPTENAEWHVRYISMSYPPLIYDTTLLKYSLRGDTLINSIVYKKVCRNVGTNTQPKYLGIGGLREQNKRIYYLGGDYLSHQGYDNEILLYDFTLVSGC